MKMEISIEEKARRYDEAYKKVAVRFGSNVADEIFLKESEDEKIRKELLTWLKSKDGQTLPMDRYNAAITWLEKQGNKDEEILTLKDQIESLHVAIKALKEAHKIELEKQGTSYTKRDIDDAYLKGISDAKNEIEKQYEASYQIRKDIATFIFNYKGDIKDRAKWIDYLGIKVSFTEKQGEQKPAWSEEDEEIHRRCICAMRASACGFPEEEKFVEQVDNWLESLKGRVQPQPKQEWSEEDEEKMNNLIQHLKIAYSDCEWLEKTIYFLKSLKERCTWKPSDEQMEALEHFIVYHNGSTNYAKDLEELRLQLKKLIC